MTLVDIGSDWRRKDLILWYNTTRLLRGSPCTITPLRKASSGSLFRLADSSKSSATFKPTRLPVSGILQYRDRWSRWIRLGFSRSSRSWRYLWIAAAARKKSHWVTLRWQSRSKNSSSSIFRRIQSLRKDLPEKSLGLERANSKNFSKEAERKPSLSPNPILTEVEQLNVDVPKNR